MATTGHESEVIDVQGLASAMAKAMNLGISNKGTCTTAAGTAAKTVQVADGFALSADAMVLVTFQNAVTVASATLNVNSTGAKPIKYGGAALEANLIKANMMVMLRYYTDGENADNDCWNVIGDLTPSGFTFEYDPIDMSLNIIPIGSATASYDPDDKSINLNF